jgi:flagellar hook-associated protein 1
MASLSSALNYAISGLTTAAAQTAVVSRNIAFANDPGYSRKYANLITLPGGVSSVASYGRSADKRLLDKLLDVTSSSSGKQAVLNALTRLSQTIGDPESDSSITALVGKLQHSLQAYEANPSNALLAADAFRSAAGLASGLNQAAAAAQEARKTADEDMAASVGRINTLLDQFKIANDAVVRGAGTASDLSDNLDQRDRILKLLSEEIGIRTTTRPNNDIAIYTDGGVTLFETNPREVTMEPTLTFQSGVAGKPVYVDGVRITGLPSAMPSSSGKLHGLAEIRDRVTVTYQTQLDEVARGLIEMFAESDQQAVPSLPDVVGLFTYDGAPAIPPPGAAIGGLAARIRINPLADPAQGGNPALIRDGGFGGAAYIYNSVGDAGFQDRIAQLIGAFETVRGFDPVSQLGSQANIKTFSANSSGWIEARRQQANQSAEFESALKSRTSDALLRVTGVNIDEEMAAMLDLEKAYQASSKVLSVVDGMLASLLEAIG